MSRWPGAVWAIEQPGVFERHTDDAMWISPAATVVNLVVVTACDWAFNKRTRWRRSSAECRVSGEGFIAPGAPVLRNRGRRALDAAQDLGLAVLPVWSLPLTLESPQRWAEWSPSG